MSLCILLVHLVTVIIENHRLHTREAAFIDRLFPETKKSHELSVNALCLQDASRVPLAEGIQIASFKVQVFYLPVQLNLETL